VGIVPEPVELRRRLSEICERWELPGEAPRKLERLLLALADDPQAPTTVASPMAAVDVHVADSLSGLPALGLREQSVVVDIGSGAGFPGLPLAVALPDTRFDLLESSRRKCLFLERLIAAASIENTRVVRGRAEEWAAGEGAARYTTATARAIGSLGLLVEYAAPLLQHAGLLVAWKGRRDQHEELGGEAAAAALNMRLLRVDSAHPYPGSGDRSIHVYEQVGELPPGFPRRPGMARKRPLGTEGVRRAPP
jgi:16S rRNA (guanine527-N7)-methyltransferase